MKFGFIGLGNIGREIAGALCASAHPVHVHDVIAAEARKLAEIGAFVETSPRAVAGTTDILGICVQDDAQVLAVMDGPSGILAGGRPGLLVLIHSTVRVQTIRDLAERAAPAGIRVIDAPVTRASGQVSGIVCMVGGASEDVREARAYLDVCMAKSIETGPLGTAMVLKICNNMLTYLQVCGARDILNLANAAGLDIDHLVELTKANGVASPSVLRTFERRGKSFVHGDNRGAADIERMGAISEKDLDCALETARDLGVELPSAAMSRATIRKAIAAGFARK